MIREVTPGLEHVFTIEADISMPRSAGQSPLGERLHIPITGGRVYGPKLEGRVLPGGSDWPLIGPDGASRIEARYTIEAEDGTLIYIENIGIRTSPPEVTARLRAGEAVLPSEYYMRGAPKFDAPTGPHRWLSECLFICTIVPKGSHVVVDIYKVT
jgi:hypothetical protein